MSANPDPGSEHLGTPAADEESPVKTAPAEEENEWSWRQWVAALVALVLVLFVLRQIKSMAAEGVQKRPQKQASEETYFRRFGRAARAGDPAATYRALVDWLDAFPPAGVPATVRGFVTGAADEEIARESEAMERLLFGGSNSDRAPSWSGHSFSKRAARARRRLLAGETETTSALDTFHL